MTCYRFFSYARRKSIFFVRVKRKPLFFRFEIARNAITALSLFLFVGRLLCAVCSDTLSFICSFWFFFSVLFRVSSSLFVSFFFLCNKPNRSESIQPLSRPCFVWPFLSSLPSLLFFSLSLFPSFFIVVIQTLLFFRKRLIHIFFFWPKAKRIFRRNFLCHFCKWKSNAIIVENGRKDVAQLYFLSFYWTKCSKVFVDSFFPVLRRRTTLPLSRAPSEI